MHTSRYSSTAAYRQPPVNPIYGRGRGLVYPPSGGFVQTVGALGQEPIPPGALGTAIATGIGGVLGGSLVGYIASSKVEGAATGAMFAGGLAGIGDALLFFNEGRTTAGSMIGLVGLGFFSLALWRFREGLPAPRRMARA